MTLKRSAYAIRSRLVERPVRIFFVSDLHNADFRKLGREMEEALEERKPDVILSGGDLITACRGKIPEADMAEDWVRLFTSHALFLTAKGNHEQRWKANPLYGEAYKSYEKMLRSYGAIPVDGIEYRIGETGVAVSGWPLPYAVYEKGVRPYSPSSYAGIPLIPHKTRRKEEREKLKERLLRHTPRMTRMRCFRICLMHNPIAVSYATDTDYRLFLSGHNHGGIVGLPFGLGLMTPQFELLSPHTSGIHKEGKALHIISRGLGTHTLPIRWNNAPELVEIELRKEENL